MTAAIRAAVMLAILAAMGCDGSTPRPNIVLVTIDTLRADRLSAYGYSRKTTPFLDQLAARSVRFERAYSSSSWTAPAMVSLLTSLHPTIHGVEHGFLSDGDIVSQEVIPDRAPYWAELLRQRGYRSFGVTANSHLQTALGFARGFDRYRCLGFDTADAIETVVAEWQQEILSSEPYFLWIHYFDPHAPYEFHDAITRIYAAGLRRMPKLEGALVPELMKKRGVRRGNMAFQWVNALYDGEIRYTDDSIRRVFAMLDVTANDLVIVTADHGEEFSEHGRYGHGNTLYEEVIRVPLIVQLPGGAHRDEVVETVVRDIDVLPSVLEILRIPAPDGLRGRSLLPVIRGEPDAPRESVSSLTRLPGLETRSLTVGTWKYIDRYVEPRYRRLYDLSNDPGEKRDLIETQSERATSMSQRLLELEASARDHRLEPGEAILTGDQVEQLKSLGYFQ